MGEENAYCGVCLGDTGKEIPLQWCYCTIHGGVEPTIIDGKEIDCSYTRNLICPWCGYEDRDSWEVDGDSGTIDCGSCDKEFEYERNVEVTYTTTKNKVTL